MSAAVLRTLLENRWVLHMNYNIKPAMIYTFAAYYFFPLKSIYNIGEEVVFCTRFSFA